MNSPEFAPGTKLNQCPFYFIYHNCLCMLAEKPKQNGIKTWNRNRLKRMVVKSSNQVLSTILCYISVDIIEPHQYVQNNVECIRLLSDIKTSLLLPQTHTLNQYQPRCLQLPSMIYLIGGETKRQVLFLEIPSYYSLKIKLVWHPCHLPGGPPLEK